MSSISAILKLGKVKRFQEGAAMHGATKNSLTLHEQVTEFITTNGDQYLLPYLTKFDRRTVAQGKKFESTLIYLSFTTSLYRTQQHGQLHAAFFLYRHCDQRG